MKISNDEKKALLRKMVEIRLFEEKIEILFQQQLIPGFVHLSIGQEASTVGSCSVLRADDYIISTHRGHAHILAKGAEPKYMFAECFGKVTGYCKGKGGSMHIADFSKGHSGRKRRCGRRVPDYDRCGPFHKAARDRPGRHGVFRRRRVKPRHLS